MLLEFFVTPAAWLALCGVCFGWCGVLGWLVQRIDARRSPPSPIEPHRATRASASELGRTADATSNEAEG